MKKRGKKSALPAEISADNKKKPPMGLLTALTVNTVIVFSLYRFLLSFKYFEIVLIAYMTVLAAFVLAFVIYNRGFSRRNVTREMLPDDMTEEEKDAFIGEAKERLRKSKWMLTVILPFVFTFAFDAFSWLFSDIFSSLFG